MTTPFFNPGARDGFDGSGAGELDGWLPVQFDDAAVQKVAETSVVESVGRTVTMNEETRTIGRFDGFTVGDVAKGEQYGTGSSYEDQITLTAKKVGGFKRIAEEDLRDLITDPLAEYRIAAGDALAIHYDNSALATTAAIGAGVKYRSVYRVVRNSVGDGDGFDSQLGYTDDDNWVGISTNDFTAPTTSGTNGYDTLSDLLQNYEVGRFFEDPSTFVIAHPTVRGLLRKIKDANGQPAMTQNGVDFRGRPMYDMFGYPVRFSFGARTHAVNTQAPSGNPLVIMGNARHLLRGPRALSPQIPANTFGVALQRSMNGPGFLSDEAYMKAAFRRAFNVTTAFAFTVLEIGPGSSTPT